MKKAYTIEEQIARLKSNGMIFDNEEKAKEILLDVGYYRLGFYSFPYGEFYQFNLSSCIRQQNSLTAQFVSFSLSNLANIFYPPNFYNN